MTAEAEIPGGPGSQSYGYGGEPTFPDQPPPQPLHQKGRVQIFIERFTGAVNYNLLVAKSFYFFFFAAFGALWPLLGVYFKQLGMNPAEGGTLIGFRPFIEFFSAPFWGSIADKFKKGKHLLLFSLFCWVFFTVTLTFISPATVACIKYNSTHLVLTNPYSEDEYKGRSRRSLTGPGDLNLQSWVWQDSLMEPSRNARLRPRRDADDDDQEAHKHKYEDYLPFPTITRYGMSPIPLRSTHIVANEGELDDLVSPPFSSAVYKASNVRVVFGILLFLMIIGEFFSAPAMTLADSATLGYLGDDSEAYGRQRLFGSFGWAITMFFIGIALDHSTIFANHPCGNIRAGEKNYTVCFVVFSLLMIMAFVVATQFHFEYDGIEEKIQLGEVKEIQEKIKGKIQKAVDKGRGFGKNKMEDGQQNYPNQGTEPGDPNYKGNQNDPQIKITLDGEETAPSQKEKIIDLLSPFIPRGKPGQSGTMPGWITVLRIFANYKHGAVLYLTWFMGFGVGLVFTFLFWHLQDIGGGPTLFGMASVINHVSEVAAYFFSKRLIMTVGHIKVLYLGLCGNIARFLYISWLRNPWWILPFELVQGLTHATVWAACCSYITQACPEQCQSSAQIIMQGIHHGLGRGCGALIGGILVYNFGTMYTFRGYGIACIVILVVYAGLNYIFRDRYYGGDKPDSDPHEMLEESSQLAPCGVPMNPMSRNLSSSKLNEHAQQPHTDQYGSTKTTNGFLDTSNNAQNQDLYHGGRPEQSPAGIGASGISVRVPSTVPATGAPYSQGPPPERPAAPTQPRRPPSGGSGYDQRPADYDSGRTGSYDQPPRADYDAPSGAGRGRTGSYEAPYGGSGYDQARAGYEDTASRAAATAPRRSGSGQEEERATVDRQQHRVSRSASRDKEYGQSIRAGSYGYDQ